MEPERRAAIERQLEAGDPHALRSAQARVLLALVLVVLGAPVAAVLVLATAVAPTVRYVRQQWLLGGLLADAAERAALAERIPVRDLRDDVIPWGAQPY